MKRLSLRALVIAHDLLWVPIAVLVACWLHKDLTWFTAEDLVAIGALIAVAAPVHALTFSAMGCYRGFWRYASLPDLFRLLGAVGIGAIFTGAFFQSSLPTVVPPAANLVLYPVFLFLGVIGMRVSYRVYKDRQESRASKQSERVLVIGAGRAGNLLIRDVLARGHYEPFGILDDNRMLRGSELHGVRILGTIGELEQVIRHEGIRTVLVAIPSAPKPVLAQIVDDCTRLGATCWTLPSSLELASGQSVDETALRPVTVEDLLSRQPVRFDDASVHRFIAGKSVLITGGGGSIGAELCRQIAAYQPAKVVVLESSEHALYKVAQELNRLLEPGQVVARLGDCKDAHTVERVLRETKPKVVFHSAAYKHVPLVEDNVAEGVANNVLGTQVVADLAVTHGVETFVLISTDKAVNPSSFMGASKRLAECYCQSHNRTRGTHFITTRFGNVLASAGSVVPLFEEQIRAGGPVTVTHPEIERFFMTIPEAVSLILQAGAMGRGGEIFVLDMGEPVRIRELAEKMIRLSGRVPDRDIRIVYTGLRPGEKLTEELFYATESLRPTDHPLLLLANSIPVEEAKLNEVIGRLEHALVAHDLAAVRAALASLIPTFAVPSESTLKGDALRHLRVVS